MYIIEKKSDKYHFIIVRWDKDIDEKEDLPNNHKRIDLSDSSFPLQVALITANKDKVYPAHCHLPRTFKASFGTQELWYLVSGGIKVDLFDTDGNYVDSNFLIPGEMVITYLGGHRYTILEDNTKVIEIKSGPYFGQELDKVLIE